ncbi:MAG: 1-acyl-sn-glycerol-3-phosphate acyltransferase [Lachnospiraceae bacterium]|nr:1-acyl-sn-glycerol-3-phosphate acyltransferase [Lachnospiraceae bacterium]
MKKEKMSIVNSIASFVHMLRLPKPEYEVYCRKKRLERFEKYGGQVRHLKLHSLVHRFLIPLMKVNLCLGGKRLIVLRDDRKKTKRPVIFCPTHIGGVDIEMSFLAIKTPCWILLGDPRELYKSLDGMLLQMNGWIPMDVPIKEDRVAAKAQMTALLQKGGNLLLFPEGAQNVSVNALLSPLYAGAVDLAITCGAEIVPIAVGRDGDRYYFILGENISCENRSYEDRFRLTDELRDRIATLKWEIIEQLPPIKRAELSETAYDDFIKSVITMNTEYTLTVEDIKAELFHPKGITEPVETFAFMDNLIPCRENVFLFNKRLSGLSF